MHQALGKKIRSGLCISRYSVFDDLNRIRDTKNLIRTSLIVATTKTATCHCIFHHSFCVLFLKMKVCDSKRLTTKHNISKNLTVSFKIHWCRHSLCDGAEHSSTSFMKMDRLALQRNSQNGHTVPAATIQSSLLAPESGARHQ